VPSLKPCGALISWAMMMPIPNIFPVPMIGIVVEF
jgi:hypothetical protein